MLEEIVKQIILQMPVVAILLYNNVRQDERFNDLLESLLKCIESKEKAD
jgi:hypothetical protein